MHLFRPQLTPNTTRRCFFLLLIFVIGRNQLNAQTITTVAGTGSAGYSGDGTLATGAQINGPFSVATDTVGNIFIADRLNSRVRKVTPSGVITTLAGTGTAGYNGDNIAASTAQLNYPTGVAVNDSGIVYVSDRENSRIRKIDRTGIITTVAGNGTAGFSGDGGPATGASLNSPRNIAVDAAGNIYVADQGNNRVRVVRISGVIYTMAGTPTAGYNGDNIPATDAQLKGPYGVAVDRLGNVYIGYVDNYRIRKIDGAGYITTVAGSGTIGFSGDGGPATAAQINEAIGIAPDSSGGFFIADAWNARIRYVNAAGTITTIAGTGTLGFNGDGIAATSAQLNNAYGVALNRAGNLLIPDYSNSRIRYITDPLLVRDIQGGKDKVRIYPNPNRGSFTVTAPMISGNAYVIITSITGQILLRKTFAAGDTINILLNYPTGLYILRLITNSLEYVGKIVLE